MFDPVANQFAHKEVTSFSNQVRNKLQRQARDIETRVWQLLNRKIAHQSGVSELIGEIDGYIEIRRLLCPCVAQDGYSGQLKGLKAKLIEYRKTFDQTS